jgi:hypothetical protein
MDMTTTNPDERDLVRYSCGSLVIALDPSECVVLSIPNRGGFRHTITDVAAVIRGLQRCLEDRQAYEERRAFIATLEQGTPPCSAD